jgi:hyperosmotically inducible periplasmic protein
MNNATSFNTPFKRSLMCAALVAMLGLGACHGPDGQMSDSEAAAAPKESASLGAALDDIAITAKVKQRLASDERIRNVDIAVETNNGVVTLSGSAPSGDAKDAAEELARNVAEVQGIDNKITAPSLLDSMTGKAEKAADRAGSEISDATITTKVKTELAADDQVKATDIKVETERGVVSLTGQVASADIRARALSIVRKINGVKSVDSDELKVAS